MSTTTHASSSSLSSQNAECTLSSNPPLLPQTLPDKFDPNLAYLLGLCCEAASHQYSTYVTNTSPTKVLNEPDSWRIESVKPEPWDPDFSKILALAPGYTEAKHCNLTVYEQDVNRKFVKIPAGFIVQLEAKDRIHGMIVVAFHGTNNSYEADKVDNVINPVPFGPDLGSVHGGFYGHYTNRDHGTSLSDQVLRYLRQWVVDPHMPVRVTGHSMGGAMATLCALDIVCNGGESVRPTIYSLASPRVAAAPAPAEEGTRKFVSKYQKYVPDSYRIVNTEDDVPKSPSVLGLNICAHILGDDNAIEKKKVDRSPLDQNVVSFTDPNLQNGQDSLQACQTPHSCRAVYLPFLKRLSLASGG